MAVYHGRNAQILMQTETQFATAPATPAATRLKFSELEISDGADYIDDPTVTGATALARKRDCGEQSFKATGKSILCLNDIGFWLTMLWGAPSTTGTGPYTHTWTLSLAERPTALLELAYNNGALVRRWLGTALDRLKWSATAEEQDIEWEMVPATEVSPAPTAVFDATPTEYAKARACAAESEVYDVAGASTLGRVSEADIEIVNGIESFHLADGAPGFGVHVLGQPEISGNIKAIFDDVGQILQYQEQHTSVALSLVSKTPGGAETLTVSLPAVELDKPKHSIQTSKGLMIETAWRAHDAGSPPTITVVNSVASYG